MPSSSALTRRGFALLAVSGALALASCGGDTDYGLGRLHPVSGTVTYNGQPLEKGQINFFPDDPKGVGAVGVIENGSYVMSTTGEKDGARAGKYKVTIIAKEDSEAQAKAEFEKAKAKFSNIAKNVAEGAPRIPPAFAVKAARQAKSLIPVGYGDVRSTNLTAEVKEQSNSIPFELSDTNAPPDPPKAVEKGGRGR